jgi:hypothetical protein
MIAVDDCSSFPLLVLQARLQHVANSTHAGWGDDLAACQQHALPILLRGYQADSKSPAMRQGSIHQLAPTDHHLCRRIAWRAQDGVDHLE